MTTWTLLPDWQAESTPFKHTWKGIVNVDQFRWLVRGDMQDQLRLAHEELGARHVRAVGMLDDEMRVLTKDPTAWREPRTHAEPNWQINTMIMERLLEIGIHPMITTAFMPGVLAAGNRTVFETRARISQPKDMAAWRKLVGHLTRHLINHFGLTTIQQCYFEVWNEPNLQNGFFEGDQKDFFELYAQTVSAIKEVDASLQVGGPSTARAEWIPEFMEFARDRGIEPEYLIGHVYNNDSDSKPLSPFDGPQEDQVSKSPHFASGVIRGTRKYLETLGYRGEVHWNEWGRSWFPCEPVRETANEAAYICKTMGEVSQCGDYFAYWCLSDIYDQVGYGRQTFHGNYGMLNLQGLRKPSYQAFQLLGRLGTQRVPVSGENLTPLQNAIATRSPEGGGGVLCYAYDASCHNPPLAENHRIHLQLPEGAEVTEVVRLTARENNILHHWHEAGHPDYLSEPVKRELQAANSLRPTKDFRQDRNTLQFDLDGPGIAWVGFENRPRA